MYTVGVYYQEEGRGERVVMVTIVLTSDWRNSTNLISHFIKQNRNRLVTLPTDSQPAYYEKAVKKERNSPSL